MCDESIRPPCDFEPYVLPSVDQDLSTTAARIVILYGDCWSLQVRYYTDEQQLKEVGIEVDDAEVERLFKETERKRKIGFAGNGKHRDYDRLFVREKLLEIGTRHRVIVKKMVITCPCSVLHSCAGRLVDTPGCNDPEEINKIILHNELPRAKTIVVFLSKCMREDLIELLKTVYGPTRTGKERQFIFIRANRKDEKLFGTPEDLEYVRHLDEEWIKLTEADIFKRLLRGFDEQEAREYFVRSTTLTTCYITAFTGIRLSQKWREETDKALVEKITTMSGGYMSLGM